MNRHHTFSKTHLKQIILILADGVRPDILQDLLDQGNLPGIAGTLTVPENKITTATSVFPSTTGPAHLPFLTGCFPGTCDITGIRWFDPKKYRQKLFSLSSFRSYMGLGNLLSGRDISPEIRTLFQDIPDHGAIASNIRRGMRVSRNLTFFTKILHNIRSFMIQDWSNLDSIAESHLLEATKRKTPFIFSVFYSADSNGHKQGPRGDKVLESYRRTDSAIGHLGDILRRENREKNTLLAVVSDHGMSRTFQHLDLCKIVENIAGPCLAHPTLWHGFLSAKTAVMVSGNSMAHIYIRSGSGWGIDPFIDQPDRVMMNLIDTLLNNPAIDQIAGRCSDGSVLVMSQHGKAIIAQTDENKICYRHYDGDPFNYPAGLCGIYDDSELHKKTLNSDYPDAPRQLLQIFSSHRCGHLVVTAAPGYDLRARYERPPHLGSHGSLHRQHMIVPMLFNQELKTSPWRTVDFYPTALQAIGIPLKNHIDGKSLLT